MLVSNPPHACVPLLVPSSSTAWSIAALRERFGGTVFAARLVCELEGGFPESADTSSS